MSKKASSMSLDISVVTKPFNSFFHRFHTILFFLVVSVGLFISITILLSIINLSSSTATSSSQTVNGTFDQETIDRINQLGNKGTASPGNRPSPFVE